MFEMILKIAWVMFMVVVLCITFFAMYLSFWAITSPNGKDYARENNRYYKESKELSLDYKHDMKILQDVHKEKLQEIYAVAKQQRNLRKDKEKLSRSIARKTLKDLKKVRKFRKSATLKPEIKESIQNKGE